MMFGALATCPLCSGSLCYSGGMYRCRGFLSAWSKCSYSTHEPERLKGKWKVPEETNNQYLSKVFNLYSCHVLKYPNCDISYSIVCSGLDHKRVPNLFGYCLHHHPTILLEVKLLTAHPNQQRVKVWET